MFREMRRKDRQMDDARSREVLRNGEWGVLSTTGVNGYAYGVPLHYVYQDDHICFHCAPEGSKLVNIAQNNRVSFCVVGKSELQPEQFTCFFESVIVFGRASEVEGEEKLAALAGFMQKYSAPFLEKGLEYIQRNQDRARVYKISIEQITGKERSQLR